MDVGWKAREKENGARSVSRLTLAVTTGAWVVGKGSLVLMLITINLPKILGKRISQRGSKAQP